MEFSEDIIKDESIDELFKVNSSDKGFWSL